MSSPDGWREFDIRHSLDIKAVRECQIQKCYQIQQLPGGLIGRDIYRLGAI